MAIREISLSWSPQLEPLPADKLNAKFFQHFSERDGPIIKIQTQSTTF